MQPSESATWRTRASRTSLAFSIVIALVVAVALAVMFGRTRVSAQSLPGGWADQDIGSVGLAGSASSNSGTFTLQGAGADIWGTADSFNFANQSLAGDGQIVAHVASMTNTNTYAKAGVMIRDTLTAGSAHVMLDMKPGGGVEFMTRATAGGSTSFIAGGTGSWLKLVRSNGVFTASVSSDGITWTSIGSKAVALGTNVWVGLVVCSHNTAVLNTSVFDHVSVTSATDSAPTVAITSPASGAGFSAGANISIAANASDGDATPVARVDFYANNGTGNTLIGSDTSSPYAITWSNVAAGSYALTAVATDTGNRSTTSPAVSVSVAAGGGGGTLPAGWADQDIGAAGLAGSASYSSGTFTVKGAGADIWGTADSFNFANQSLAGDGQIVAHVASIQNTNTYAKAGVMIRESLTASSPHVILDVKPGGGVEFMARATAGGSTSFIAGGTGPWLKLVRSNGTFTASVSANGSTWTVIGSKAISMATNVWVGLAVCSHNTGVLNTSIFDNVAIGPVPGGGTDAPPAVTITTPANGATFTAGTNITVSANATDGDATPVAKVDFYANNQFIATDTTSPYSVTWSNAVAGSYALTAVATDTANQSATSGAVSITVASGGGGGGGSLPTGWTDQDIGAVAIAGSASYSNGTFTVKGAGTDIYWAKDSLNFASRPLSGAGQIVAHVAAMTNTSEYAKAGVMIRASNGASSRHVTLDVKPNGAIEFLARAEDGGSTAFLGGGTGSWLKLVRSINNGFTAYVSTDGATWQLIGSTVVTMPYSSPVMMGLAVCSHNSGALSTAVFDNVTDTGRSTTPPAPVITSPPSGTTFPPGAYPVFTATMSQAVSAVELYVGDQTSNSFAGAFFDPGGGRPYTNFSLSRLPGTYTVTAVARYADGSEAISSPITIQISSTPGSEVPPTITSTSLANGAVLSSGAAVTMTATASDPDSTPVQKVEYWFYVPADWYYAEYYGYLGGATTSPYAVTWTPTGYGSVSIAAVVTDSAGVATASWIDISIK